MKVKLSRVLLLVSLNSGVFIVTLFFCLDGSADILETPGKSLQVDERLSGAENDVSFRKLLSSKRGASNESVSMGGVASLLGSLERYSNYEYREKLFEVLKTWALKDPGAVIGWLLSEEQSRVKYLRYLGISEVFQTVLATEGVAGVEVLWEKYSQSLPMDVLAKPVDVVDVAEFDRFWELLAGIKNDRVDQFSAPMAMQEMVSRYADIDPEVGFDKALEFPDDSLFLIGGVLDSLRSNGELSRVTDFLPDGLNEEHLNHIIGYLVHFLPESSKEAGLSEVMTESTSRDLAIQDEASSMLNENPEGAVDLLQDITSESIRAGAYRSINKELEKLLEYSVEN